MAQTTSLELYYRFVAIIDQVTVDENIYAVPKAAGMVDGNEPQTLRQRWNYSYTDGPGIEPHVHERWWDSSKPFSIEPDIHVTRAELKGMASPFVHECRYETPLYG